MGKARERPQGAARPAQLLGMARVAVVTDDLLFGSRLEQALIAAGHEAEISTELRSDVDLMVVDLTATADPAELAAVGPAVIGYYSHVDPAPRDAALDAGIAVAVPRSRLVRDPAVLVEEALGKGS